MKIALAQFHNFDAKNIRSDRASTVAAAGWAVGDGADMARSIVRTLADRLGVVAPADSVGTGDRHVRRRGVDCGGAVSNVGREAKDGSAGAGIVGVSGSECAYVCESRRQAGRVVFQPGCHECRRGSCGALDLSLALLSS